MSTAHVTPEELALSQGQLNANSKDLHGCKFGDLRAEVVVGKGPSGNVWRLRCLGCGGAVFMTATAVRTRFATVKDRLACPSCTREEKRGARSSFLEGYLRELWALTGSLYSPQWDEYTRVEVMSALETEVAPVRSSLEVMPLAEAPPWESEGPPNRRAEQRAAYLYPLRVRRGRLFRCATCKREFRRGLGCTLCIEPVCVRCVRKGAHTCTPEAVEGETYLSIGNATHALQPRLEGERKGVTRETIRQIIEKSLRKIRANCSAELGLRDEKRSVLREYLMNLKVDPILHYGKILDRIYLARIENDYATVRDLRVELKRAWHKVYPEHRASLETEDARMERGKVGDKEEPEPPAKTLATRAPTTSEWLRPAAPEPRQPDPFVRGLSRAEVFVHYARKLPAGTLAELARARDETAVWCLQYIGQMARAGSPEFVERRRQVLVYIEAHPVPGEAEQV